MTELALIADSREWLVMHRQCAATSPGWYAADICNPVNALLWDLCPKCGEKLGLRPSHKDDTT